MLRAIRLAASLTAFLTASLMAAAPALAQDPAPPAAPLLVSLPGSVPDFAIRSSDDGLERVALSGNYFDKVGSKFAMLGEESGSFEAWAWPVQLFRDFRLSFFIGSSTTPIASEDIVQRIRVEPETTTITYVFQSFTIKAHYVAAQDLPGGMILLDVDSTEPLRIVAGFIPTLTPMWPAGLGGQYAYWYDDFKAYLISESARTSHGFVGSPAASGLSYTPAHMLSEQPNEFAIVIDDPATVRGRFIPIVIAGGPGDRAVARRAYDRIVAKPDSVYGATVAHFDRLRAQIMRVTTPDPVVNRAVAWAAYSYDNLMVSNPQFARRGLVAGLDRAGRGGRPGFGWFFGGDSYINSLSLNALGAHELSADAIAFNELFQREDGKMPHEVTQATSYVDWFNKYGYAYIHGDTSPYYVAAVYDHFQWTADSTWVRDRWPSLKKAYVWSKATDEDGDGLMDNTKAGLGALEFGSLTGIQTDIYLSAVWLRATDAMRSLARVAGDDSLARAATADHEAAVRGFEKFWNPTVGQYAYAFNKDGATVDEITPWAGVALMWGYGQDDRARHTLERLARADMTTDWGVRMMSTESKYYEPLNYNYGAVWPFLTSWVASAQYARGLPLRGFSTWRTAIGHVENRALGHVTEVMSGAAHTWPQESVPHQGFCTAATVLPFVGGLLGIRPDAPNGLLTLAPSLPADWPEVTAANIRVAGGRFDVVYRQPSEGRLSITVERAGGPARLHLEPSLPPGSRVRRVSAGGRGVRFETENTDEAVFVRFDVPIDRRASIEIEYDAGFSVVAPVWKTHVGDTNAGIKIVGVTTGADRTSTYEFEGLAGTTYRLGLTGASRVGRLEGATIEDGRLVVTFPNGPAGTFTKRNVRAVAR